MVVLTDNGSEVRVTKLTATTITDLNRTIMTDFFIVQQQLQQQQLQQQRQQLTTTKRRYRSYCSLFYGCIDRQW